MAKKSVAVKFTPDEAHELQSVVHAVWDECAYDVLTAIAEEKGKSVDAVTVSRAVVIEIGLDAGRAEERLRGRERVARDRGKKDPNYLVEADMIKSLLEKMGKADYKQLIRVVRPAFTFSRYGT